MIARMLVPLLIAATASLLLTPVIMRCAHIVNAIDQPEGRKMHTRPMPRLGGLAIYLGFFISLFALSNFGAGKISLGWLSGHQGRMLVALLPLVLILGLWDDIKSLRPSQKVTVQLALSTVAYLAGFRIDSITHPFENAQVEIGILSYPLTVLWIVGVTNAINLIDGLDGLAAGVAFIVAMTIASVSLLGNDIGTAAVALLLGASICGFLPYNFNPAHIFLGDSGSLFLGFALSLVSIQSATKSSTAFAILVPVLALGLPIVDTLLSMIRRLVRSFLPFEQQHRSLTEIFASMFLPDKSHIHHRLIAKGLSHRTTVLTLYVISCVLGIGSLAVSVLNDRVSSFIIIVIATATVIGVRRLGYSELALIRNGSLLPLYDTPISRRDSFIVFLDAIFSAVAFLCSYLLTLNPEFPEGHRYLLSTLMIVCVPQVITFWLTGMYKGTVHQFGFGDSITIAKAVAISGLVSWLFFLFFSSVLFPAMHKIPVTTFLFDFYILLSLVLGLRISFRMFTYIFERDTQVGMKVLIYGADSNGVLLLQNLLDSRSLCVSPVGFLDENPSLEGRKINGFPVFGGHWKLQSVINRERIDELIISGDSIKPEVLARLQRIAREHKIVVKKSTIVFEDVPQSADEQNEPVARLTGRMKSHQPAVSLRSPKPVIVSATFNP